MVVFCKLCERRMVNNSCFKCSKNYYRNTRKIEINLERPKIQEIQSSKKEITEIKCPKSSCTSSTAYVSKHQMRAGDEAETLVLTCTLCSKIWRA